MKLAGELEDVWRDQAASQDASVLHTSSNLQARFKHWNDASNAIQALPIQAARQSLLAHQRVENRRFEHQTRIEHARFEHARAAGQSLT